MTYEIVTTDNGDLLRAFTDRDEAVTNFLEYVDSYLPTHPGIEHRLILIELDDRTQTSVWTYEDLRAAGHHAAAF